MTYIFMSSRLISNNICNWTRIFSAQLSLCSMTQRGITQCSMTHRASAARVCAIKESAWKRCYLDEALALHVLGNVEAHVGEHSGRHVRQLARRAVPLELSIGVEADEGHEVCGVRGDGEAVLCEHHLCIAMVRRDEQRIPCGLARLEHDPDGSVGRLHPLDGRIQHPRVPHHVGGGEVAHHELVLLLEDRLGHVIAHSGRRHLRLKIVRGDLRRWNHLTVLIVEDGLVTAVEEEGDVRVFLGLRAMVLLEALLGHPLRETVAHDLGGVHLGNVVPSALVLREGGHQAWLARLGALERHLNTHALADLAHAVGAVVEEQEGVAIRNAACGVAHVREDEFVRLGRLKGVAPLQLRHRLCDHLPLVRVTADDVERLLHALPTLVAIHRPVAPHHRGDGAVTDFCDLVL
mmetsp:Transcript_17004/g.28681  ORF Transcript_17004/g.28681 Transcript_17004/m.28681 type:complete len:406 (+) Transcript_17004:39-1256(+)